MSVEPNFMSRVYHPGLGYAETIPAERLQPRMVVVSAKNEFTVLAVTQTATHQHVLLLSRSGKTYPRRIKKQTRVAVLTG